MEFNLPKTLKALLFSTSEPLAAKDIQDVFTRWRQQAEEDLAEERELALATTGEAVPGDTPPTAAVRQSSGSTIVASTVPVFAAAGFAGTAPDRNSSVGLGPMVVSVTLLRALRTRSEN